jgi:hypothetical protein
MSVFSTLNYITPRFMVQDPQGIYGHAIEEHVAGRSMAFAATLNGLFLLYITGF